MDFFSGQINSSAMIVSQSLALFIKSFLIFFTLFAYFIIITLFWRKRLWTKSCHVRHSQSHILCYLLNFGSLVSNHSDLKKLHIFLMHLQTLHISVEGVDLALVKFVESCLFEELGSDWMIGFRSILEKELKKLFILCHNITIVKGEFIGLWWECTNQALNFFLRK